MAERFLFQDPVTDDLAILSGDQSHHLARVMRARVGDRVVLFNGRGVEHDATIVKISKNSTSLQIDETRTCIDPNAPEITVAVALPKGDRQKFLVEKLVELGTNRLIPLGTERSVAEPSEKVIQRINKQVIEATKQCRRSWLMTVSPATAIPELLHEYQQFKGATFLADPYQRGGELHSVSDGCVVAIGPEGGFSDAETVAFTNAGFQKVRFSPNVLRIETAAAAAVAILRANHESPTAARPLNG